MEPELPKSTENPNEFVAPSYADVAPLQSAKNADTWFLLAAFGNWFASIVISLIIPVVLVVIYALIADRHLIQEAMKQQLTPTLLVLTLVGTFIGQIFSLLLSALIITEAWQKPFFASLGWRWTERFRLPHAFGLAIGMLFVGVAFEKLLPHQETSLDKYLKFGLPVRIALAVVATIGAPIVEEVIYRGLLFGALERKAGVRVAVVVVTLLFWGVHVAQYIESIATLAAVFVLSFALTYLRASTKQLLPGVVVHTIFNGIQGILIVLTPQATDPPTPQPALQIVLECVHKFF